MKISTRVFFNFLIIVMILWLTAEKLIAQESYEEGVIKLQNERNTDLEAKKSELGRDYNYLTNSGSQNERLFDNQRVLGLSDNQEITDSLVDIPSPLNYFRFRAGSGFFFIGELNYTHSFDEDLLKIYFSGLGRQKLMSVLNGRVIDNSKKYRFDVQMTYTLVQKSKNESVRYLHTFEGTHVGYNIGLQSFRSNTNNELFYYNFQFKFSGYYLFQNLALDHTLFIGGGKYTLDPHEFESGFIETGYNLTLSGVNKGKALGGLFGNLSLDMDWLWKPTSKQGSDNYRFLLGLGIGYDWDVTSSLVMNFYLGHVTEIIKNSNDLSVDAFSPVVVLPKIGVTYFFSSYAAMILEAGLKVETENLRDIYNKEEFYDNGIFPYLHRLAEGKFAFRYNDQNTLQGVSLEPYLLYDYYFIYDRAYYIPGQLKQLTQDKGVHKLKIGLNMKLKFLSWLALEHHGFYHIPLGKNAIFPVIDTDNKLIFIVSPIFSRFIFGYRIKLWDLIFSKNKNSFWTLNKQRLDLSYEFEYRNFVLMLSISNILDNRNYQRLPEIRESGFSISGGVKYQF